MVYEFTVYRFSFSIFTIEVNGTPTVAFQAKRHKDAEKLCEDRLRTDLSTLTSNGIPLCDARATMKVRLANPAEEVLYRQAMRSTEPFDDVNVVYLVDLDGYPRLSLRPCPFRYTLVNDELP
jgi:hypothetical protein